MALSSRSTSRQPWKLLLLPLLFALTSLILQQHNQHMAMAQPPPPPAAIRIACGMSGNSFDYMSRQWIGDVNLTSNSNAELQFQPADGISVPTSSFEVLPKVAPFLSSRVFYNSATYTFKHLSPGRHFLRFWFVDDGNTMYPVKNATFSVYGDDNRYIIRDLFLKDAMYHINGVATGYLLKEYVVDVTRNSFELTFSPAPGTSNFAMVSGIELQPVPATVFPTHAKDVSTLQNLLLPTESNYMYETVYRMNVGGNETSEKLNDQLGRQWSNYDASYLTSHDIESTIDKVKNVNIMSFGAVDPLTAPIRVYMSARAMSYKNETLNADSNLTWSFAVDPLYAYVIRLHFCELKYWTSLYQVYHEKPRESRAFDVSINDKVMEHGLDVLNSTWSVKTEDYNLVMVKDYHIDGHRMDINRQLQLALRPLATTTTPDGILIHSNVMLNGIEVFRGFRSDVGTRRQQGRESP